MANRYTQLSGSQFNPMSLQELMMVPAMKRKKHDDTIIGIEELRSKLASVDPEDKYFEEAVALKESLNNKFTNQVEKINKEGVTSNTTTDFLGLNREYQDTVGPTGKLGMINQEKLNTQAYIDNYRKEGLALGLTPAQMQPYIDNAIKKRNEEMPLYDEKGRTIGYKIDKGVVKAQDIFKDFNAMASSLGISEKVRGQIMAGIQTTADGQFTYANTTGFDSQNSNNQKQINNLLDFLNSRLKDPNSDYSKYYDYIGQDKTSIAKALREQSGMYLKESDGFKSQQQISNLIDNRGKSGSGNEDPFSPMYSHASETTPVGNDADIIKQDAQKILNDPNATTQDKILARQKLDLIDDVKTELTNNDKEFQKISLEINNKLQNSGLNKNLQEQIKEAPFINTSFARNAGGGNWGIYLGKKMIYVTTDELKKINSMESLFNKNQKRKFEKINESLSTRGLEETTFTQDMEPSKRTTFFQNVKDALNTDTTKPTKANYINSDGKAESLQLNDQVSAELMNLLTMSKSDGKDILSADPARQGNSIGLKVKFKPGENSKVFQKGMFANKKFDGSQAIEMFIPITEFNDGLTGLQHTSNRVYNQLPSNMRKEIDKMVQGSSLGATTNLDNLGNLGVPADQFFPNKYDNNTQIDFLQKGKLNNKSFTPYTINKEGVKKPIVWNTVVDFNRLNDPEYLNKIGQVGLFNNIEHSYMIEKNIKNNELPKDSRGNIDYLSMINYLKYKDLKLPSTQDLIEFSQLNRN
jgi:hypothetical protein